LISSGVVTYISSIKINSDNPFFFVKGGSVYYKSTREFLSIIYYKLTREFLSIIYVHFINSDNPFFFVKGGSVYCKLTREFLNIIYVHFRLQTYGIPKST
jgi:hypothetical protein